MTFAIAARCEKTGRFGVGVATLSPAVGGRVPHFAPNFGVVLSMAYSDPRLGHLATELLRMSYSAPRVLHELEASDAKNIEHRQLAVIDLDGTAVARTGALDNKWCGAFTGKSLVALGNNLTSERTAIAMRDTYLALANETLEERLLRAIEAGRDAGGQNGGQLSAALVSYGTKVFPYLDLRVDAHAEPVGELRRVYEEYRPYITYYWERSSEPERWGTKQQWKKRWLEEQRLNNA
jgi:uncharacterized Ntn-hydrolase superfamily protein